MDINLIRDLDAAVASFDDFTKRTGEETTMQLELFMDEDDLVIDHNGGGFRGKNLSIVPQLRMTTLQFSS